MSVRIFKTNAVLQWSSHYAIQENLQRFLVQRQPKGEVSFLVPSTRATKWMRDESWVFLPGVAEAIGFDWLSRQSRAFHLHRPPCVFFITGEAAKVGYNLVRYGRFIRADDKIVVPCDAERRCLERFFPAFGRFYVMYFPVAPGFRPRKISPRTRRNILNGLGLASVHGRLAIYAGRISRQKNVFELVQAFVKQKEYTLLIAGSPDYMGRPHLTGSEKTNLVQDINSFLRKAGRLKTGRVIFLPHLSQARLVELFNIADAQVSFSTHFGEDFGYSIVQGLNCGLKTAILPWGGHREWTGSGFAAALTSAVLARKHIPLESLRRYSAVKFRRWYNAVLQKQWRAIFQAADRGSGGVLIPHPKLRRFYSELEKSGRAHFFKSEQDPIFRFIRAHYSGKVE